MLTAILCLHAGLTAQSFTPGDIYVADGRTTDTAIYQVTAGGDFSSALPFATIPDNQANVGTITFSNDNSSMYIAGLASNTVYRVDPIGNVSPFATGISSVIAVDVLFDGRILAQSFSSGGPGVVDITLGGDATT